MCPGMRSVETIVRQISSQFYTKDVHGEWVVRTTTTPCTSAQDPSNFSQCDFEFSGWHPPEEKQLGAWEADLPPRVFGPDEVGSALQLGRSILPEEDSTIIWKAIVNSCKNPARVAK